MIEDKVEMTEMLGDQLTDDQFINFKRRTIESRGEVVGSILKYLRQKMEWTQSEVARKIGVVQQTYAGYESGKHQPNIEMIIRLADLYDMTLDFITGRYIGQEEQSEIEAEAYLRLEELQKFYKVQRETERVFLEQWSKRPD